VNFWWVIPMTKDILVLLMRQSWLSIDNCNMTCWYYPPQRRPIGSLNVTFRASKVAATTSQHRCCVCLWSCIIEALSEMASIGRQMSLGCSKYAVPALCYVAFPPCANQDTADGDDVGPATSRRPLGICRDDCRRLINVACKAEYDFARRTTMRVGMTSDTENLFW